MRNWTGKNVQIEKPELFKRGNEVYLGDRVRLIGKGKITIGDETAIAQETLIISDNHDYKNDITQTIPTPVKIGSNCWVGARCIILGNSTIGNNCVIGAGSVVRGKIKPNTLCYGNPCKEIKKIKPKKQDLQKSFEEWNTKNNKWENRIAYILGVALLGFFFVPILWAIIFYHDAIFEFILKFLKIFS